MTKPWYKQFWPWFILAFPISAVIASFTTLFIFLGAQPDMVVDDYYKQGKAINFQKDKQNRAVELKLSAELSLAEQALELAFSSGHSNLDGSALKVNFFHTTLAEKDFSVMAVQDAHGNYHANVAKLTQGKWQISIEPFDASWRLRKTLSLPVTGPIELTPFSH